MKLRHFIPSIPILGIIYIIFFSKKNYKQTNQWIISFKEYIWGPEWNFWISGIFQGISISIISNLIF